MSDRCKLLVGDCREKMLVIPDCSIDAIVTDPPYGVDYQSAWRTDASARKPKIANDCRPFIWWLQDAYRVLKDGSAMLCFCEWRHQEAFRSAIELAGFKVRSHVIWDRDWHGMADPRTCFAPQHDVIWFASKGRFEFPGERPKSVLRYRRIGGESLVHPNEKPVELMRHLVRSVSSADAIVLDPFAGSGSTGVACKLEGRNFVGIELNEQYAKLAEDRIANAH